MNSSYKTNQKTREEWNALGFYYAYDEASSSWQIMGTKEGILIFCELLRKYAKDLNRKKISEHEHYGPYSYLKFITWGHPKIQEDGIYGKSEDFFRLSEIIRGMVEKNDIDCVFLINKEYSNDNKSSIKFFIKKDNFFPASMDYQITGTH